MRLFSNRSQKTSKCGKNISDTLGYRLVCHFFVLTTFWRHLWSITEQTHGNMESIGMFHPSGAKALRSVYVKPKLTCQKLNAPHMHGGPAIFISQKILEVLNKLALIDSCFRREWFNERSRRIPGQSLEVLFWHNQQISKSYVRIFICPLGIQRYQGTLFLIFKTGVKNWLLRFYNSINLIKKQFQTVLPFDLRARKGCP